MSAHPVEAAVAQAEREFANNNFGKAAQLYEDAIAHGNATPELIFSLATAYFRAENIEKADHYFAQVAGDSPLFVTALLNRGLIAVKMNREAEAVEFFNAVIKHAPNTRISQMAEEQLAHIEEQLRMAPPVEVKNYVGLLSLGFGVEDSTLSPIDELSQNNGSPHTEFDTYWMFTPLKTDSSKTSIYASGFASLKQSAPEYNTGVISTGGEHMIKITETQLYAGIENSIEFLDDAFYQNATEGFIRIQRRWQRLITLRLRGGSGWVQSLEPEYDFNTGWRHRLRGEFLYINHMFQFGVRYEYEINQRNNQTTKKSYYSYSPTRNSIRGVFGVAPSEKWNLQTTVEYRDSEYPKIYIIDLVPMRRNDNRLRVGADITFPWSEKLTYHLSYRYQINRSTIDTYDNERNDYSLGIDITY